MYYNGLHWKHKLHIPPILSYGAHTFTRTVHTAYTHWPLADDITMWRLCTVKQPSKMTVCLDSYVHIVTKLRTQKHCVYVSCVYGYLCICCLYCERKLWFMFALTTRDHNVEAIEDRHKNIQRHRDTGPKYISILSRNHSTHLYCTFVNYWYLFICKKMNYNKQ